ncbi:MAG TPA: SUMF1/EgtB/PvdO family nonheme iron enzyme [Kofleriaceae bacterium]|nr:SUMF1/EgtB/PvdO family nonheme iron enzyme [Kofleriaceae bacterium]
MPDTTEQLISNARQLLRDGALGRFMEVVAELGLCVARGETSWSALHGAAETLSPFVVAARAHLDGWRDAMYRATRGNEREILDALERRTQLELAREWFRGTPAGELFDDVDTDDETYDALAVEYYMLAPPYAPRSHTWWVREAPRVVASPTAPAGASPVAPAGARITAASDAAWIAIPAGSIRTGLTDDEARRLAIACADATMRWVRNDPDVPFADLADAENRGGNASYLEPLLRAAFPPAQHAHAAFAVRATPVTNAEYAAFVAATRAGRPASWDMGHDAPTHPVRGISHDEAEAYARWAGAALPTEHEWERAARGPDHRLFPWGDELGDRRTWMMTRDFYAGWPVGSNPMLASVEGIHDLVTEHWEWTSSRFSADRAALAALTELYPGLAADGWVRRGGRGAQLAPCSVARTGAAPTWRSLETQLRLVRR